ncbi:MAG: HD domain-containing phosphohydrolase [Planctomycetota bacterium]|jgi:putative nucleotidyltransferase with HDIG domain
MNAKIVVLSGERAGETFLVRRGDRLVIGSDASCNIPITDEGVAPEHLAIAGKGDAFVVESIGESPIQINDQAAPEKVLRDGDVVSAGGLKFRFGLVAEPITGPAESHRITLVEDDEGLVEREASRRLPTDSGEATKAIDPARAPQILAVLYEVGQLVNAETNRTRILESIVDKALEALEATRGFLILYDKDADILTPAVIRMGDGEDGGAEELTLSKSILAECVRTGTSILCRDAISDSRFSEGGSIVLHGIRSALCVPVESSKEIRGALYVDNLQEAGAFDEEDMRLLAALGRLAGDALERALWVEKHDNLFYGLIRALVSTIEAKDQYTRGHTERVTTYSMAIGEEMGLTEEEKHTLQLGALLHDVGKIGIPEKILKKPGKLTPGEYEIMKRHPDIGADILEHIEGIGEISDIVRFHQEKFDGTGYPQGLKGDEIPLYDRIVGVADAYDAMTSSRSYRRNFSEEEVMKEFNRCAGFQFDRVVVEAFFRAYRKGRIVPPPPVGSQY